MKREELDEALTNAGVCPTCGQSTKPEPKHEARKPHPNTMAGK